MSGGDLVDARARARLPAGARGTVAALAVGYVGVYLCRKNLAVAVPLLGRAFGANRGEIGRVASIGTAAYALGKLTLGPLIDRVGGRAGFLAVLFAVALFGGVSALAPSLVLLTVAYSANRYAGAGGWPAIMKLVPTWFGAGRQATVVAVLSLSYVAGGIAATLLARQVLAEGGGWRAVMGVPSLALLAIGIVCVFAVRAGPLAAGKSGASAIARAPWRVLLSRPQFLVVCALSFALTLMRESFNTWSVDFLVSIQRAGARSVSVAALQSTTFDLAGGLGILIMGASYDRTPARVRRWLIAGILGSLALLLALLPWGAARTPASAVWLVGAVGLLVYGPYSLLAGVFAVESGGAAAAATAAAIIDACGYLAGILAGEALGRVLDRGGYPLGFECLAAITTLSALLACLL
jgi:MFS transporter, ACS family, hexuronate transporter